MPGKLALMRIHLLRLETMLASMEIFKCLMVYPATILRSILKQTYKVTYFKTEAEARIILAVKAFHLFNQEIKFQILEVQAIFRMVFALRRQTAPPIHCRILRNLKME